MTDGMWRITRLDGIKATGGLQGSPSYVTDEIRVWWDTETDAVVPGTATEPHGLVLLWPDGRADIYPWNSILKAEYTPPTREEGKTP